MSDELGPLPTPEPQLWGCVADSTDTYQLKLPTRDAAVAALGGEAGTVVRYERGYPREGLEYFFDIELLISRAEEHASRGGQLIADFEDGIFDVTEEQEGDLQRRLADALHGWIKDVNPPSWVILESEDIEVLTNAQNTAP